MRNSISRFKRSGEIRPLRIILDYETLKSDTSKRILEYANESCFEFIALGDCSFPDRAILGKDEHGAVNKITLMHDDQITGVYGFGWLQDDIQSLAKHFEMREEDLMVLLQFIALTEHTDQEAILITECKKLLDRKRWGQTFGDVPHNRVLSPEAASIFMDLYIKSQRYYILFPHVTTDAVWLSYLYSMKNKIPNRQRPWSIAVYMDDKRAEKEAFIDLQQNLSDRLTDMLSAIDQMGKAFYFERGNDQQDALVYHFNYWISLYEGVFDNIATLIDYRYGINFNDPIKISLRGSTGGDFLTLVDAQNNRIRPYLRAMPQY